MSAEFRQKLVDELSNSVGSPYAQMISMFDHGEVEIRRYDWASTYNNALLKVFRDQNASVDPDWEPDNFLDTDWNAFTDGLENRLKNANGLVWLHNGSSTIPRQKPEKTNLKITYAFVRGTTGQGVNIDQKAENATRAATVDYFANASIFSQVDNIMQSQVYEHGTRSENLMSDDNPRTSSMSGPGSQTAMEGAMANKTTASGAGGTKTSNRLIGALQKELKTAYRTQKWFGLVHSLVKAKWADLFGFDSDLVSADSDAKSAVKAELTLKAGLVPNLDGITHNPGTFDRALRRHLKKFLTDKAFFKNEIFKLVLKGKANPNTLNHIDALFSDSPTPKARIEKAAIKLAAKGVLDELTDKVVRKTSAGRNAENAKAKRGRSKGTSKNKKGRKATTRRAATVKRKTSKQGKQNAIQGNPIALKEIINAKLPNELLKQMQLPKLRNRTGRFRNSAQVTNVMVGPRGGTHIEYTYMKNPYQTFEPGGRQGSVNRDPRRLIGGTVREIAQELMGKRFIKVRSV